MDNMNVTTQVEIELFMISGERKKSESILNRRQTVTELLISQEVIVIQFVVIPHDRSLNFTAIHPSNVIFKCSCD